MYYYILESKVGCQQCLVQRFVIGPVFRLCCNVQKAIQLQYSNMFYVYTILATPNFKRMALYVEPGVLPS